MDNTAGSKVGQSTFDAIPKTQTVSDQYNTPQSSQQTTNTDPSFDPFEDYSQGATPQPVPQQNPQQTPTSNGSEQISVASGVDDDDKDDRITKTEEVVTKETPPVPSVQPSHPEIQIKKELSEIVQPGPDAERKALPEEPERLGDVIAETQTQQETTSKADELPMPYGEALLAKRKERSIKNGVSWVVREIVKQWKQKILNKQISE